MSHFRNRLTIQIDAGLMTELFLKTRLTPVKYNAYCLWDDVVLFLGFQVSNLDRSVKVGTIHQSLFSEIDNKDLRGPVSPQVLDSMLLDHIGVNIQFSPTLDCLSIDAHHLGNSLLGPSSRYFLRNMSHGIHTEIIDVLPLDLIR